MYDKLVAKVDNIGTSEFALRAKYQKDKTELENKIPNASNLVKKTDYNTKITEIEGKAPDISNCNLATKTALTAVENKIPDVTNLATKNALTTAENKIPGANNFATKTALTILENKIPDVSSLIKNQIIRLELLRLILRYQALMVNLLKIKQEMVILKKLIKKLTFFLSASMFFDGSDGFQAYGYYIRLKFNRSILRKPKVSFAHGKRVNIYIVYKLAGSSSHSDDSTLKNCLSGAVVLTKNSDIDKYGYSGYGIGGRFGQNVLIFGADMSSSTHIDNKKIILGLEKGPTQGLEHTCIPLILR